jgi:hypothetical protein
MPKMSIRSVYHDSLGVDLFTDEDYDRLTGLPLNKTVI